MTRRHRWTLRSALVLALVVSAVVVALGTATAVVLVARPNIYEARQNTLLREFADDSTLLFRRLSTEQPPETWDYYATNFPGRARIVDLATGRDAGSLPAAQVPASLTDGWESEPGRLRYLRTTVDGQEAFYVATTATDLESDPGGAIGLVTMYTLEPERRQVQRLLVTGGVVAAAALLVAVPTGLLLGGALTRPLRRLSAAAADLGVGRTVALPPSRFADVDAVASALQDSSARLAATVEELARREGHARRLVSDVAHELRTPLTSMVAVSEILDDLDGATPEERRTAVAVTRRSTDRLTALISDLLEVSRLDAGVVTPRTGTDDLGDVVVDAVELADPGGTVAVDVPERRLLTSDLERVRTIVSNLVANALRHGRPPVRVVAASDGELITVDVVDDGPGIPPELRERVFEPFAVVDPARPAGGSGLGLAIARENARLLGGDVEVLGSATGAHLRLTLPASPPAG